MKLIHVGNSFERWREVARDLVASGVPPGEVVFSDEEQLELLPRGAAEVAPAGDPARRAPGGGAPARGAAQVRVSEPFLLLARKVACHRDPSRWARLYRVLWRTVRERADVLGDLGDPEVLAVTRMAETVRHDVHRFHGLVRFRVVAGRALDGPGSGGERYVAYHRPDHRTLPLAAPFFVRRFAAMRWSILTPEASAHWDGRTLVFGEGVPREFAAADEAERLWREYYASTFNPARVNPRLLRRVLPQRHWDTLPEGGDIAELVRSAGNIAAAPRIDRGAASMRSSVSCDDRFSRSDLDP